MDSKQQKQAEKGRLSGYLLILVMLALFAAFVFQGTRGLYDTTEGRYAECAREMVASGNYLEPTLDFLPHWSKPPLTYWAIGGGIKLLGKSEWGVRLYNAVAFFLTILIIALIGALFWGRAAGVLAGLVYLSSPFPLFSANVVSTDTLLTFWEVAAVLCYVIAWSRHSVSRSSFWIAATWTCFGLGFLTKGPPALLPLLPLIIWNLISGQKVKLLNPVGLLLFGCTGLSWYLVVIHLHPKLLSYFLGHEMTARFTSHAFHNADWYKPFTIYLPVLILGAGAWLVFAPLALRRVGKTQPDRGRLFARRGPGLFLLLWLVIPLAVFFLAKSRLPLYVLPLYAPVALILAGALSLTPSAAILRKATLIALVSAVVLVGVKGLATYYPSKRDMRRLYRACRAFGGARAHVAVFDRRKLYGLQYYLDGYLDRFSYTGKEPWANGAVGDVLKKVQDGMTSLPYLFVVDRAQEGAFRALLKKWRISFSRRLDGYWRLYLLYGGPRKECAPEKLEARVLTLSRRMW